MKKIISLLIICLCLCGCEFKLDFLGTKKADTNDRYLSIVSNIFDHTSFSSYSNYYDISAELASIDGGYRYYITIDNPRNALYDVEALAVEEGVDYSTTMAANVGIYESNEYCLIPNQTNVERGYVEGLVISGVTQNPATTLYVYVSFKNEDHSVTHTEYIKLDVEYQE